MLDPTYAGNPEDGDQDALLSTHGSGLIEKTLEYQLLGALTAELLRRGMRYEVLRGDFDLDGYDIVIAAGGVTRHVQLKCMAAGGKTARVPLSIRLRDKPSGCVIWMTYDPAAMTLKSLRWFGGSPGMRLPDLGDRVARHTRGNKDGVKALRQLIRIMPAREFDTVPDIASLADRLFGSAEIVHLRRHLRQNPEERLGWLGEVQAGNFAAIPPDLDWNSSGGLAMLVDGYGLADELGLGDPMEFEGGQLDTAMRSGQWRGNAAELWVTLFLEHRRWHFSSPYEPYPDMVVLLDRLVATLREALVGEIGRANP